MRYGKAELIVEDNGKLSIRRISGESPDGRWMRGFRAISRDSFDSASSYVGCTQKEKKFFWKLICDRYQHMTYEDRLVYARQVLGD